MKKSTTIFLWIFGLIISLFLVCVSLLPTWISTTSGQKTFVKWVNYFAKGTLSVDSIKMSWLGAQKFENLTFKNAQDQVLFSTKNLETNTSLLYLLFGGRSFNDTSIDEPYLYLTSKQSLKKEKNSSKKKTRSSAFSITFPEFSEKLIVNNGKLVFDSDAAAPVIISHIQVDKDPEQNLLSIEAQTEQGTVQGTFFLKANLQDKLKATALIKDFPVTILDQIYETSLFTEALGNTLNAEFVIEKNGETSLSLKGKIDSTSLTGYVEGVTKDNQFEVSPQTNLTFTLSPKLFHSLIDVKQRANWDLASKTNFKIQIEKGVFPLTLKQPDFHDIVLQASALVERAELNHSTLGSYSLNRFEAQIISQDNLEIDFQGEIQGKESTKLTGQLSITPSLKVLFQYHSEGFPVSLLGLYSSELEKNTRLIFGHQFNINYTGTWVEGFLDSQLALASNDTELKGEINGKFPSLRFNLEGIRKVIGDKSKILGKTISFDLDGTADFSSNSFSIPFVKGTIYNPYYGIDFRGQLGEKGKLFTPNYIQLIATGFIHEIPLNGESIKDGSIYIQVDGSKNLIVGKIEAANSQLNCKVQHFIQEGQIAFDQASMTFSSHLHNFPVSALSPIVNINLSDFIGRTINLDAEGHYSPKDEPKFSVDLTADASGFSAQIFLGVDGALQVKQNRPSFIEWEMTPERYNALMRHIQPQEKYEPLFTLTRATKIELQVNQLLCPTSPSKGVSQFLCESGLIGDLQIGRTTFRNLQTNESIVFQEITGSVQGANFSEAIDLNLHGNILAANVPTKEKSSFSFEGQVLNLWTNTGHFNREGLTVKGMLSLDLVPVRQLTGIAPIDPETRAILQAVLGELLNARIYGEISQLAGPLTIDIKSSNFKAKLPLSLQPHAIYLRDHVDAEITLTEAVNETLLTDINPLFLTGAYSEHPLKIYIEPNGFKIPIRPYSLQGVQIGTAIIDIGRIGVKNGGNIQLLMNFLKATNITPDGWMSAWFTPIYMHLEEGVATYKRFDALLADRVHIALWGSVNLITNQVRMTLAIAPKTLQQQLGISGLSKNELFQVKMRGTTQRLELDWSSAYTRISFIVARAAGGQLGYLVGGILEQLIKSFGEEPSPPPTTDPLPWEKQS